MMNAVNGLDTLQNILYRIVNRVFSGLKRKSLMPHVLQSDNLFFDFFLRQLPSSNRLVLRMIRTVRAAVYTVIREVEGGKKYDSVTVKGLLDFLCEGNHLLIQIGNLTR